MSPEHHLDQVRPAVRAALVELLPAGWDVKAGIATPTTLAQPTLYLEYSRVDPLPEAPLSQVRCTFELTLTTMLTDLAKGEDWADAALVDLVLALDAHNWITWSGAEKSVVKDTYLAWKVTLTALASTTPTPTNPEE